MAAHEASMSGTTSPQPDVDPDAVAEEPASVPTPEGGLFGLAESSDPEEVQTTEQLDWVSASAWAEAPWDERAELEAEELEELEDEELEDDAFEDEPEPTETEEATQAPKVPAALPMRRRKPPQEPIRSRGSGEWIYADPPARDPLVSRRYGVTPPVMLAVLGVLLVSIVVFLVATQLGGDDSGSVAAASPSPAVSLVPRVTQAPVATPEPSTEPEPTPTPKPRYYRVKAGDSLTSIATRFNVKPNHIVCLNRMPNKNIVMLGVRYQIPPEGYKCPPGWRNATPEP